MYVLYKEGSILVYPYSTAQLFADNPGTSFPAEMSDDQLSEWGIYPVERTDPPQYDPATQVLEQNTATYNEELQQWETAWAVREKTADEIAQSSAEIAASIRGERNARLYASDWTQVLDAQVDRAAWAAYRQELRDITTQVGFPWEVVWPQEP